MRTRFDHAVIAARSLESGARWLEERLGVSLSPGGDHPKMGTHNRLLRLGDRTYLELIAINPGAPPPSRPRWLGLDAFEREAGDVPRLITWMAATSDIGSAAEAATYAIGPVHAASRDSLNWLITIRDDGAVPEDGLLPGLIQWGEAHPCDTLPDNGIRFRSLALETDRAAPITSDLRSIGLEPGSGGIAVVPSTDGNRLRLDLDTPWGRVSFASDGSFENGGLT